jgi:glycine hydroxymethyltransferase
VSEPQPPVALGGQHLRERLLGSLRRQQQELTSTLILNPVENLPFADDIEVAGGMVHGLYNSDKIRSREQRVQTSMQFAGRQAIEEDVRAVYSAWADALGASDVTMRVLSGLHAYTVLFMSMAQPGQTVLVLPVRAGGHVSVGAILERLGLRVIEMAVDDARMCIDIDATLARCARTPPDFVLVDRSEGLVIEDLTALARAWGATTIFDASQYLTNVLCGHHPNPLSVGFDILIATTHKNFPGPQKALLATRERDARWQALLDGVALYVSNMHPASIYAAGLTLTRTEWLTRYSRTMLDVAADLENVLLELDVPAVRRRRDAQPTHHLWIREASRAEAFETYEALEQCSILVNFRLLPYALGFGLRLGTSAATRIGLTQRDVPELAALIAEIRRSGATSALREQARRFNEGIWAREGALEGTLKQVSA